MQAAGARLPHAQPGAGRRSGEGAAVAEGVRHLVARPLRQLQVRGRQPGPLAHAGRRGGRQHPLRIQGGGLVSSAHVRLWVQKMGKARAQAMALTGATFRVHRDVCMLAFMVSYVVEP